MKVLYRIRVRENGDETPHPHWINVYGPKHGAIEDLRRCAEDAGRKMGIVNPKADSVTFANTGKGVKVTLREIRGSIQIWTRGD